jgi:hypothetical protein
MICLLFCLHFEAIALCSRSAGPLEDPLKDHLKNSTDLGSETAATGHSTANEC